jgi:hypothetical protein
MLTFYTVRVRKNGRNYPVDYIDPQTWEMRHFECDEPFGDPGDASGEFQAWASVNLKSYACCWLEPAQFAGKLRALRDLKAEKERCVRDYWTQGSAS